MRAEELDTGLDAAAAAAAAVDEGARCEEAAGTLGDAGAKRVCGTFAGLI